MTTNIVKLEVLRRQLKVLDRSHHAAREELLRETNEEIARIKALYKAPDSHDEFQKYARRELSWNEMMSEGYAKVDSHIKELYEAKLKFSEEGQKIEKGYNKEREAILNQIKLDDQISPSDVIPEEVSIGDVRKRVRESVAQALDIKSDKIDMFAPQTVLVDPVNYADIVIAIEDEFNISLEDCTNEIEDGAMTLARYSDLVMRKLNEARRA